MDTKEIGKFTKQLGGRKVATKGISVDQLYAISFPGKVTIKNLLIIGEYYFEHNYTRIEWQYSPATDKTYLMIKKDASSPDLWEKHGSAEPRYATYLTEGGARIVKYSDTSSMLLARKYSVADTKVPFTYKGAIKHFADKSEATYLYAYKITNSDALFDEVISDWTKPYSLYADGKYTEVSTSESDG